MGASSVPVGILRCVDFRKWAWWHLPPVLRSYVALVPVAALGLTCFAGLRTTWRSADLVTGLLLLGCATVSVAATPRSTYVEGGITRDFITVWVLPAAIVLPPVYAMLMPFPLCALIQWRVHRGLIHRKVFTAGAIALGYGAASFAFHSFPASLAGPAIGHGRHALTWVVAAAICEFLVARWHAWLLLVAIKLSD